MNELIMYNTVGSVLAGDKFKSLFDNKKEYTSKEETQKVANELIKLFEEVE